MEGVGGSGKYEERRSLGGVNKRCEVEGRGGRGGRKWGSIGYRRQKSGEGCEGY